MKRHIKHIHFQHANKYFRAAVLNVLFSGALYTPKQRLREPCWSMCKSWGAPVCLQTHLMVKESRWLPLMMHSWSP